MGRWLMDGIRAQMGVGIALVILIFWFGHLAICFELDLSTCFPLWAVGLILTQTILHTGLFIISHDAIHVSVAPRHRRLNHRIGAISAALYGLFSYRKLLKCHHIHHRSPASSEDPDFCQDGGQGLLRWYLRFMRRYLSRDQGLYTPVGITVILHSLHGLLHVPYPNLVLFWALPMLLSSFQLFYFGTFLPHRDLEEGYPDHHRARSCTLPPLLSLLSCYHFGYHWEHHRYPQVPWYQLPQQRQLNQP